MFDTGSGCGGAGLTGEKGNLHSSDKLQFYGNFNDKKC